MLRAGARASIQPAGGTLTRTVTYWRGGTRPAIAAPLRARPNLGPALSLHWAPALNQRDPDEPDGTPEPAGESPDGDSDGQQRQSHRPDSGRQPGEHPDVLPPLDPLSLQIPDDARELDSDVAAYHREQHRLHRQRQARRLLFTRRWARYGLSGPLTAVILLGVALVGSLATVFGPRIEGRPPAVPLAAAVTASPGSEGGLLPAGTVQLSRFERNLRGFRPAVIALVPRDCGCDPAVASAFGQTISYRLPFYLAGDPDLVNELRRLSRDAGNGTAGVLLDIQGALFTTYEPEGLTLVLVHTDGVVETVVRDPERYLLGPDLAVLSRPGA